MPSLFPTKGILGDHFSHQIPYAKSASNFSSPQKHSRFSAWSAVDDMKTKAGALSSEAQKEISKASSAAQAKNGQIELYSLNFYAACTFGGLIACVGHKDSIETAHLLNAEAGYHTYCGHTTGPCQVSSTGRSQDVQGEF